MLALAVSASVFAGTAGISNAASTTWTGGGADTNWATGLNWLSGAMPGLATGLATADVATFSNALATGTQGAGTKGGILDPILVANQSIAGLTFTGSAGAYVINGATATNFLVLSNTAAGTNSIQLTNTDLSSEVIGAQIHFVAPSSTNGGYTFTNNALSTSTTLSFTALITANSSASRPTFINLTGTNTGLNIISGSISDPSFAQAVTLINKTGVGTWILSGANTFSGTGATTVANGIQISGGVLSAQNNAALGTNGTANTNQVSVNNGGTLELANAITLDNGLSLNLNNGGTIRSSGSTTTNARVNVSAVAAAGVTLTTVNSADVFTIGNAANDLTGGSATSVIHVAGPGTISQAFGSNYVGGWSIDSGVLLLGSPTALGTGATNTVAFGASSTGILRLNGNSVTAAGLNSSAAVGTVENGIAGTATFTVGTTTSNAYAGIIQDGAAGVLAMAKSGSGSLSLSGANTFTGGTTVSGGLLSVNNTSGSATGTGAVAISSSGSLGGTGTVSGVVTVGSNAAIAPGNAGVGTLTVGGLTLGAGSLLNFDITNTSTLDQITVTNTDGLAINGGQLNINGGTNPFNTNGTYNLIGYTGVLGGTGTGALTVNATNQDNLHSYIFGSNNGFVTLTIADSGAVANYWNADANGNWSTGPWTNGTPNAAAAFVGFGGGGTPITAPRTITVDGAYTMGTLAFNNPTQSYTLAAGTGANLILDNNGVAASLTDAAGSHFVQAPISLTSFGLTSNVITAGDVLTVSGNISGSGAAMTKLGGGTLALTGNNSYTGGTTLSAGVIQINSATSLGDVAGALTFNGGKLQLLANVITARSYNVSGTSNAVIDTNSFSLTSSGAIAPVGGGTGGLVKNGTGALTLLNSSTYTGPTTINAGTIGVGSNTSLSTGNVSFTASGTLQAAADALTVANPISIASGAALTIDSQANTFTVSGLVSDATTAGSLVKIGGGTLILTNTNTFTGGTTVSAGILRLGSNGAISTNGAVSVAGGATLDLNAKSPTLGALSGAGVVDTLVAGTLTLNLGNGNGAGTFSGAIQNTLGSINVVKNGSGVETLSGANTYTGTTTVNNGTLSIGGTSNLTGQLLATGTNGVSTLVLADSAVVNTPTVVQISNGVNGNPSAASLTVKNNASLTASSLRFGDGNGRIPTNTFFTIQDTATVAIAGTFDVNDTNGGTTLGSNDQINLNGGTLTVGSFIASSISATHQATIHFNGATLAANADSAVFLPTFTGLTAAVDTGGAKINDNGHAITIAAALVHGTGTPDGGLTKSGGGTLTLSGANTYTGPTTISAGTLQLAGVGTLGGGLSALNVVAGATLDLNGKSATVGSLNGAAAGIIDDVAGAGTDTLTTGGLNAAATYAGVIKNTSGSVGLTKVGTGTLTLSGANIYNGATSISVGTLQAGSNVGLSSSSSVTIASGAVLDLNGFSPSIGGLNGAGTVDNVAGAAASTLTTGLANGVASFSGVIQNTAGAVSLVKSGTGALTLSGTSTYSGGTTLTSGSLFVNNTAGSGTGSGVVTVNGGILGGSGSISGPVAAGTGAHTINAGASAGAIGTLSLAGGLTMNANTTLAFDLASPTGTSDLIAVTGNLNISTGPSIAISSQASTGAPSLGYYKVVSYSGSLTGAASNVVLPPVVNNIAYTVDVSRDPGFLDIHRGYIGDATDDGNVDLNDLNTVLNNLGTTNSSWLAGNFDGAATIDLNDLNDVLNNLGTSIPSGANIVAFSEALLSAGTTATPEPTSLGILALGAGALLARRRKA